MNWWFAYDSCRIPIHELFCEFPPLIVNRIHGQAAALAMSMSKWLAFLRAVVITPLPNQILDIEAAAGPEHLENDMAAPPVERGRYRKLKRVEPIVAPVPRSVPAEAWGRYPQHMRYNCDQVPFHLDDWGRKTHFMAPTSRQLGMFGTLQVCLHAGKCSSQPPLTMIFPGHGPEHFVREVPLHHPDVRVFWQRKALMDNQLAVTWAEQVFVPFLQAKHPGDRQALLLQDNLKAQRTGKYVRLLQANGVQMAFGPRNQTEYWQPIDAGHIGAVLKQLARAEFEKWMETVSNPDDPAEAHVYNWQKWERNRIPAKDKRVLMTHVFGRAYNQILDPSYRRFRQSAFGNCGALVTLTGINDDTVIFEGAPNFHPPAPGTILHDAAFENDSWTGAAAFNFSYDIAGGNDEAGPDCSASENPSEAESESHDSSSDTSDKF